MPTPSRTSHPASPDFALNLIVSAIGVGGRPCQRQRCPRPAIPSSPELALDLMVATVDVYRRPCQSQRHVPDSPSLPPPTLPSTSLSPLLMCDIGPANVNAVPDRPSSPPLTSPSISLLLLFACAIGKGWGGGTAFAMAVFMLVFVAGLPAVESFLQVFSTVIISEFRSHNCFYWCYSDCIFPLIHGAIQIAQLLLLVQFRSHLPSLKIYCLLRCLGNNGREAQMYFPKILVAKILSSWRFEKESEFFDGQKFEFFLLGHNFGEETWLK